MKKRYLVLASVLASVVAAGQAQANVIPQNTQISGTSGNIAVNSSTSTGESSGVLAADSEITFTYNFTNLPNFSELSSQYTTPVGGGADSIFYAGTSNASSNNPSPLVLASAGFTTSGPNTTGTIEIINTSSSTVSFSNFFSLFGKTGVGGGVITSESFKISSVPLPATLSMFGAIMLGMFGFSRMKKRNALAAI